MILGIAVGVLMLVIVAWLGSCFRAAALADAERERMMREHARLVAFYHCEMSEQEQKELMEARWD